MPTLQFPCCFCGVPIGQDERIGKALILADVDTGENSQQWWCHKECLLQRMVPQARAAATDESEF